MARPLLGLRLGAPGASTNKRKARWSVEHYASMMGGRLALHILCTEGAAQRQLQRLPSLDPEHRNTQLPAPMSTEDLIAEGRDSRLQQGFFYLLTSMIPRHLGDSPVCR